MQKKVSDNEVNINVRQQSTNQPAITLKLSNCAYSKDKVPSAAQPFLGSRTAAFFHNGKPFRDPVAKYPCRPKDAHLRTKT